MTYLDNLKLILTLFLPVFIGIGFYKTGLVSKSFPKQLVTLLFNILLPCSIISSMQYDIPFEEFLKATPLHIISILSVLGGYLLAIPVAKLIEKDEKNRCIIWFSFMFSNFIYSAYPILEGFYGKESIFYASLFNVFQFVLNLTLGISIMQKCGDSGVKEKFSFKKFISPPFVALVIGILLFVFDIKLPSVIGNTVNSLGSMATPLSMLTIGMIVAREKSFDFKDRNAYIVSLFRLIIIPILTIYILKAFGCSGYMLYVPVIISANPFSVNTVLFSENYGGRSDIGANYIIISSVLSIFTIPFIQMLI